MTKQKHLVLSRTAGGWNGLIGRFNDGVQRVAECYQILEGNYNAGAHHALRIYGAIPKNRRRIWTNMRKRQRSEVSGYLTLNMPSRRTSETLFGSIAGGC
jgi:hypothetical protein